MRATTDCHACSINPDHSGDCRTIRGRGLARPCRDCGKRFALRRTQSKRVRCLSCIEKRAAKRAPATPRPETLAEYRCRLECAADPNAMQRRVVDLGLLRSAVGAVWFCPECDRSLDAKTAVLYEREGERFAILCGICSEGEAGAARAAEATRIIDGIYLNDPKTRMLAGMLGR